MNTLFQPYRLNDTLTLANRFMMAPLTRCMAGPGLVPTEQMAAYYGRRADIGLIISEATIIRPDGQGYPNTPGLYSAEQIAGWKKVTSAVHANGGKIFAQLWHVGRLSHPFFHHAEVLAPSAVAHEGTVPRMRELVYQVPRALTGSEIAQLVEDYAQAAANAIEAGFDGVEIHGANGYLIDQFLHHASNLRTDNYGGSPENMSRFALEVVDAIAATRARGGRVVAVGTTSVRSLESAAKATLAQGKPLAPFFNDTDIFIFPGYEFQVVDAMITNFHLPESTLIMLVSAFAGYDNVMAAYQAAVAGQYRFFSYGDAMFVTRRRVQG